MVLSSFGISFHTTPLSIRESFAIHKSGLGQVVHELAEARLAAEVLLLSTCHRTEFYCAGAVAEEAIWELLIRSQLGTHPRKSWLKEDITPYIYRLNDNETVKHLMTVASGLNSLVLGEAEILGQIKTAYHIAKQAGCLGKILNRLFQMTFNVAKQVRTQTDIGVNPLSIATLSVNLAARIFRRLDQAHILLVGAGQMMQLTAKYLKEFGVKNITIANRSFEPAQRLANDLKGEAITLEEIASKLYQADIVIAATDSRLPILGKGMVERALRERKRKPVLMIDLSLPRNIEPEIAVLEDVYLYHLEDLKTMADENRRKRQGSILHAENIIQHHVEKFKSWLQVQTQIEKIAVYRHHCDSVRDQNLKEALKELKLGKSPEIVLAKALTRLTNRLMHQPTLHLREMMPAKDPEILSKTEELLGINHERFPIS